jgi:hypothetical protein
MHISDRHRSGKYSSSPSELSDDSTSSGTAFSRSSPSDLSSSSDKSCRCDRYGVTRSGQRVKLDCGGRRCGYSGSSSECSSEAADSDSSEDERRYRAQKEAMRRAPVGRHDAEKRYSGAHVVERKPRR